MAVGAEINSVTSSAARAKGVLNRLNAVCSGSLGNAGLKWTWGEKFAPLRTHTEPRAGEFRLPRCSLWLIVCVSPPNRHDSALQTLPQNRETTLQFFRELFEVIPTEPSQAAGPELRWDWEEPDRTHPLHWTPGKGNERPPFALDTTMADN
ncbi:Hypothetical predicted protein [Marmota monax]|uniref:Uncharacterized protein n=1 Tax=Marmota monax TaxID=9995 RepID=A0A5E4AEG5_MARMO|nr:Hypothetical predicted protein [Marmota monax]